MFDNNSHFMGEQSKRGKAHTLSNVEIIGCKKWIIYLHGAECTNKYKHKHLCWFSVLVSLLFDFFKLPLRALHFSTLLHCHQKHKTFLCQFMQSVNHQQCKVIKVCLSFACSHLIMLFIFSTFWGVVPPVVWTVTLVLLHRHLKLCKTWFRLKSLLDTTAMDLI